MTTLKIPNTVERKLDDLIQICEKYPDKIPLPDCAHFMGINTESLRASIETGTCPFGIGWLKKNANCRAFYIPTTTFYLWYTQSAGFKQ